jgi:hypothetical protein
LYPTLTPIQKVSDIQVREAYHLKAEIAKQPTIKLDKSKLDLIKRVDGYKQAEAKFLKKIQKETETNKIQDNQNNDEL